MYLSRHAEHESGADCWCIPMVHGYNRVVHRSGTADVTPTQTTVGVSRYYGGPRNNPNPIHAGIKYDVRMALDPAVFKPTFCGVNAHSLPYDKNGVAVETFDPDHSQACRKCANRYRALMPVEIMPGESS